MRDLINKNVDIKKLWDWKNLNIKLYEKRDKYYKK